VISTLRGTVQHVGPAEMVVEVGGVGLTLAVPTEVAGAAAPGQTVFLFTRMVVREDSISLYGFSSLEQREAFDLLLQVDRVGPRLALAVLSHLSAELLRSAVAGGQLEILTRVPGVGRKTAESIVFHLRDKLEGPAVIRLGAPSGADTEVLQALTALGYTLVEAQAALQSIPSDSPKDPEERVRLALQYFARP
jgi:Holliday junction DNA helicase RuvA